jgi:hypothetical protein
MVHTAYMKVDSFPEQLVLGYSHYDSMEEAILRMLRELELLSYKCRHLPQEDIDKIIIDTEGLVKKFVPLRK